MTNGRDPTAYLQAFKTTLFLSADPEDVRRALAAGIAAAHVMPHLPPSQTGASDDEIRLGFDFDCVLADDSSETVTAKQGLPAYEANEIARRGEPLGPAN